MIPPGQMPPPAAPPADVAEQRFSQDEVAYGPATEPFRRCGDCAHFQGPAACELVQGTISPDGVCDLFSPGPSISGPGQPAPTMGFEA